MRASQSFTSTSALGPMIASFVELRRALGRDVRDETAVLEDLDRFLAQRQASALTAEVFDAWALTLDRLAAVTRRNRLCLVRALCLHLRRTDPLGFVPDTALFPSPQPPKPPFIFSEAQILNLLDAADKLAPTPGSPLRPQVYRLAVTLLYTSGLRRGELARLALRDYDPRQRTLLVRESKFHKSRVIAVSHDCARELDHYLLVRQRLPHTPEAPLLANCRGGHQAYSGNGLTRGLHSLFRAAGVFTASGDPPRPHDLRHSHALHVLLKWYRAGIDLQAKLPVLAASMGHVSIASTAYYIRFVEPLAEAAAERFARHARPVLGPARGAHHA